MRFLGNIEAKLDSKGRVFLPASFRKSFSNDAAIKLVLRKDVFQNCLVLYPEDVWNDLVEKLRSRLSRWNKQHQEIFRQFVYDAEQIELDSNGRVLIPKRYLQMTNISQRVRFIGMDDMIEIWSGEALEEPLMDAQLFAEGLQAVMQNNNTSNEDNKQQL